MDAILEARTRAAEMLKGAVRERRATEQALGRSSHDATEVVRAAVEGLESLANTIEACLPQLDPATRQALAIARDSAWERLASAGIERDGTVGEPLDLARHRVARRRRVAGQPPGIVLDVLSTGIVHRGTRLREAVVCVSENGGDDGAHRD